MWRKTWQRLVLEPAKHRIYEAGDKTGKLLAWLDQREIADRWRAVINLLYGIRPQHEEAIMDKFASYYTKIYSSVTEKTAADAGEL